MVVIWNMSIERPAGIGQRAATSWQSSIPIVLSHCINRIAASSPASPDGDSIHRLQSQSPTNQQNGINMLKALKSTLHQIRFEVEISDVEHEPSRLQL